MLKNPKEWMAFAIVALFALGFVLHPNDTLMLGALIAAFSTAYGYYLGGSKVGADTAEKNAETVSMAARTPVDTPQPVIVTNDDTQAVPVNAK